MGRLRHKGKGETGTDYWALVLALESGGVKGNRNLVGGQSGARVFGCLDERSVLTSRLRIRRHGVVIERYLRCGQFVGSDGISNPAAHKGQQQR